MKKNNQTYIIILLLIIIFTIPIYLYILNDYKSNIKNEFINKENILYKQKNKFLTEKIEVLKNDYYSIYENKTFKNFILTNNQKDVIEELFLLFIKNSPYVFQFRFIDLNGNEIIRVDRINNKTLLIPKHKLQNKKHRYYFKESIDLRENDFWYSNLDLNIENKKLETPYKPTLRVSSPVYYNGKKYGVLISNINMKPFLDEFVKNNNFNIFILDKEQKVVFSNFNELNWSRILNKNIDLSNYIDKNMLISTKFLELKNGENLKLLLQLKKDVYDTLLKQKKIEILLYLLIIDSILFYLIILLYTRNRLKFQVKEQVTRINQNILILDKYVIYSKTNLKGVILEASSAFSNISGYSKEELVGKPHNIVRHPDMKKEVFEDLWKTISSGETWTGEIKNRKKDGSYYWTYSTISPQFDENKKIKAYMSVRHDITGEKILEETQEQLIENEKMVSLGMMIGNIAHQWRQPLSMISTSATGLKLQKEMDLLTDEDLFKHADNINDSAQYLSETIEIFRKFIEEKKELKKVIIQEKLQDTFKLIEASLSSNHIELKTDINSCEPIEIEILMGELKEAIINIITNAKDALVENKIKDPWIEVRLEKNNKEILIIIEDNAGGIPKDVISNIYDPYFTTKHKSQGTGLGLYIVYKIITEHIKGDISEENTENGARFILTIPHKS